MLLGLVFVVLCVLLWFVVCVVILWLDFGLIAVVYFTYDD